MAEKNKCVNFLSTMHNDDHIDETTGYLKKSEFFSNGVYLRLTLDLRSRVLSIRDEVSDVSSVTKSPLPAPKFFTKQSFSSKKERLSFPASKPPPTPRIKVQGKGCASVSRLFSNQSGYSDQAQSISFRDSASSLSSKYDSSSNKLYFHQCFEVICKLGSGSFGDVFKVKCKEDGKYYAVKRAKEKFTGRSDRARKIQEVQKHEQLPSHPNCVTFYKAWEEKQYLYIQTELCSCSLSQYADKNHNIPESIIWSYLIDLLSAVKHLHNHNLVHLDIKPDNIFISEDGVCKLGDFGLVLDLSKPDVTDAIEGDPRYIAPELMQGIFTKAADIFSLGITILELACDLDLPQGDEMWHQLRKLEIPAEFLKGLSFELCEVIFAMMEPDYLKRPTVADIFQIDSVNKVFHKKSVHFSHLVQNCFTPESYKSPSSDWSSSIPDDVFYENAHKIHSILNDSCSGENHSIFNDLSFCDSHSSSFECSQAACLAMSTPCGFRYWKEKLHDASGSPCLSSSKKKGISPSSGVSPKQFKSPRLQLFKESDSDDDLSLISNIPPKNLMSVFDSLTED
ncbi:membrane-associated tyrosine- and threonine-specific cdc2-inhibitory kinase-like [Stegodyphus dumicola]|uniref:membrane-associated tyrosine- and threonine-specific cdc2-inhibitory kinase-like n=1 Tax=Stegodyphus dumicola TaxID=202533 RepID=UPI0015A7F61D|nr:membrane-associated tyrosine- and threonine-specific cdc2-inhibitory kinase-like [Stegodyphus dumicola]